MVSTRKIGLPTCDICGQPSDHLYFCTCHMRYCSNCGVAEEGQPSMCKLCIDDKADIDAANAMAEADYDAMMREEHARWIEEQNEERMMHE